MKKIIGIILILAGVAFAYLGINKVANNTETVKFLGIKIDASNESGQTQGYLFLGLGVVLVVGGVYAIGRAKS